MATSQQQIALYKEGRLDLTAQAYLQGKFTSYTAAAKAYDVTQSTLQQHITGTQPQLGSIAKNHLLLPTEEESLKQWILSMDKRGMPPRIATVREMASYLITEQFKPATPLPISEHWVQRFISRHDTLKSKYNQKYNYIQAKCKDPELIWGWFERVQATVAEYDILENGIYNFNETGFQMGVIATTKVITGSERAERPHTIQPGNHEWVTVIETVSAHSITIPPLVIFEAVMHQTA